MVAAALLAACFLLRILFVLRFRFDSDEPQHLHVAWGWARGLIQYRDVFDNHAPLFHLLCAPLVRWLGERPDLLILMRLAMLPLFGGALWATYQIGSSLFTHRAGLWAAVLAGLFAPFFLASVEFRADDLWATLFLLAVAVLVRGRFTAGRAMAFGLLLGATTSVSLKTTLILGCGAAAALLTALLYRRSLRRGGNLVRCGLRFTLAAIGYLVVPGALVLLFAILGALEPFYYGAIGHNLLSGLSEPRAYPWRSFLFPLWLCVLFLAARRWRPDGEPEGLAIRRTFLLLLTGIYPAALVTLWPIAEEQSFLPILPLLLALAAGFLDGPSGLRQRARPVGRLSGWWVSPNALLVAAAFIELGALITLLPATGRTAKAVEAWRAVLVLTKPAEFVMDQKGELIFRKRPFFYALEKITRVRIDRHLIADTIADRLVETRTCVVNRRLEGLPVEARRFIEANYVSVGPLLVAGQHLARAQDPTAPVPFEIRIPALYRIVAPLGRPGLGRLDGWAYDGPRFLTQGQHEYLAAGGEDHLVLIWARAVEKGFSPFVREE